MTARTENKAKHKNLSFSKNACTESKALPPFATECAQQKHRILMLLVE